MPVEIDNLAQWAVGDRVLRDLLAGSHPPAVQQRSGAAACCRPGGSAGGCSTTSWTRRARCATRRSSAAASAAAVDVEVDLGDGRWLRGTVPEVYGDRLVPVHYSRLGAKHRLASWLWLLALAARDDDRSWTAAHPRPAQTAGHATPRPRRCSGPLDHTAPERVARSGRPARPRAARAVAAAAEDLARATPARAGRAADVPDALEKAGYEWTEAGSAASATATHVSGSGAGAPAARSVGRAGAGRGVRRGDHRFGALALRVWSPLLEAEQGGW